VTNNWKIIYLGDVCELITKGTTPTSVGFSFVSKGINFIKIESIDKKGKFIPEKFAHVSEECHGALKRSQLKENDILFSIAGALGRMALVTKDILPANTNQAIAIIRLKKTNDLSIDFVIKALETDFVLKQVVKYGGGVAQQNLSLAQINQIQIPLPPLFEQKQIVSILDEAFEGIVKAKANAEKNLANAREIFESYLENTFSNRDGKWNEKTLIEIGETQTGTTPKTSDKENYGYFIPFIKPGDIDIFNDGEIRYDNEGLTKIGLERGRMIPKGSVLMVCIGASIGKVGYADRDVSCNQQINTFTANKKYFPKFFYYALRTKRFFQSVIANSAQATLPIINKGKWERLSVCFPESFSEQRNIVLRVDSLISEIKRLESIYQTKLDGLEELKKLILQKAFSGDLIRRAS
jgi:type I restriction enzyme S subunit